LTATPASSPLVEPFPGPRPFSRGESAIFKGRERESRDLRDLVLSYQVVVFHSHSGSGKTSLVNAGLLPLLAVEGIEAHSTARVGGHVPPGIDASRIHNIYSFDAVSSCFGSKLDPKAALQMGLEGAFPATSESEPRLLVLDQFEELFTSHLERWQDRKPFVQQLSNLCKANKDMRVLIVIRDDHLAELDAYAELLPHSLRIRYRLERLREDSALKTIVEPLAMAGYTFEAGVAEDLVANLRKVRVQTGAGVEEIAGEFVEPVHLQVVCQNLWTNRPQDKRCFTSDDVKKFADVNQSLRSFYDRAIMVAGRKARVHEKKLRHWFNTELITSDGTRGLVHRGKDQTEGVPNSAVDTLEEQHVIRAEPRAGGLWYEITHDRFIEPIRESNRAWVAKRRQKFAFSAALLSLALLISAVVLGLRALHRQRLTHARFLQAQAEIRQARDAEVANRLDEALQHYKAALDLYILVADPGSQADTEYRLGLSYTSVLNTHEAEKYLESAYGLHKAVSNWKSAADDEEALGFVLLRKGAVSEAARSYADSLDLFRRGVSRDLLSEGRVSRTLGWVYWQLGDYRRAIPYFQEAQDTLDSLDQQLRGQPKSQSAGDDERARRAEETVREKAWASSGLGAVYASQGRYQDAVTNFQSARDTLLAIGPPDEISSANMNLGYAYFLEQNYDKALSVFKEAEDVLKRSSLDAPLTEGPLLADESVVYIEQGKYKLALETAKRGLTLVSSVQDVRWIGVCLWAESLAYLHLHELAKSEQTANQALDIFRQVKDRELESRALDTIGHLSEANHNQAQALEDYRRAVEINTDIGNNTLFAKRAVQDLDRLKRLSKGAPPR
jgi:tetratricopeptide (TPR) repeat protein